MKSIFTSLFLTLSFVGFGQTPESTQWNGQPYNVYPINEKVIYSSDYLRYFGLSSEEFKIWLEWKMANDPRAVLKLKSLKDSIQYERFLRKDDLDSVYDHKWDRRMRKVMHGRYYRKVSKHILKNFPESVYGVESGNNIILPPVLTDLPDGKYVQYYSPVASVDKREKSRIVTDRVALVFELKQNVLNGDFVRIELNGDTLAHGRFVDGYQDGEWTTTSSKSYGYYRKHFFSPFKNEQYELTSWSKKMYAKGEKNGRCEFYQRHWLESVEYYQNNKLVGEVTHLDGRDSIVYDVAEYVDVDLVKNMLQYGNIDYFYRIDYLPSKLQKNFPNRYDRRRWERVDYLDYFSDAAQTNLRYRSTRDSLIMDSLIVLHGNYGVKAPKFKSYFRVYDTKTKQLILERTIDPVAKRVVGTRRFLDGQLMDTIWSDTSMMYGYQQLIYDKNGTLLIKNGESVIDENEYSVIDGYDVVVDDYLGRHKYYFLNGPVVRNDTIFQSMTWNKRKKLISYTYELEDSDVWGQVDLNSNGSQEVLYRTKEFSANRLEKGAISISIEGKRDEEKLLFRVNGQPFEGKIAVDYGQESDLELTKSGELIVTLPNYRSNGYEASYVYGEQYELDNGFDEKFLAMLLKLYGHVYDIGKFEGTIVNNQLEGPVQIDLTYSKTQELMYTEGLPSGKIVLTEKNRPYSAWSSPYPCDFEGHSLIASGPDFKKRKKHWKSLYKTFELKSGVVDGPMTYYSSRGEIVSVVPFEHGVINGKVFQYFDNNLFKAEYKNGKLTGELLFMGIDDFDYSGYDTLIQIRFDENGYVAEGISKYLLGGGYSPREDALVGEEVIMIHQLDKSEFEAEVKIDNELVLRSNVNWFSFLESEYYSNGMLSYRMNYSDTSNRIGHGFEVLNFISWLGHDYYGFTLGDSWDYQTNLNSIHQYASDPIYESIQCKNGYFKKYFPNGKVAREGELDLPKRSYMPKKIGLWKTYDFSGRLMHETKYFDSAIVVNNEKMNIIGIQYWYDTLGSKPTVKYLIEEIEKYECASDDYYAERQFIVVEQHSPLGTMNGIVRNYFDNGALMNEGKLVNGVPEGVWKFFTPDGKLCRLGSYSNGKKNGKWLFGDLTEKAYIGDVCIDPDNENYDFIIQKMERDKEIEVVIYKNGLILGSNTFEQ